MHSQGEPFALDDVDGVLREWFAEHPSPDTQAPVLAFVVALCRDAHDDGEDVVWTPTESGFQEVGLAWVVDLDRRVVHLVDVRDRP